MNAFFHIFNLCESWCLKVFDLTFLITPEVNRGYKKTLQVNWVVASFIAYLTLVVTNSLFA